MVSNSVFQHLKDFLLTVSLFVLMGDFPKESDMFWLQQRHLIPPKTKLLRDVQGTRQKLLDLIKHAANSLDDDE
jgi:hypothetical protein